MWVVSLAVAVPAFGSKTLSLSLSVQCSGREHDEIRVANWSRVGFIIYLLTSETCERLR